MHKFWGWGGRGGGGGGGGGGVAAKIRRPAKIRRVSNFTGLQKKKKKISETNFFF